MVPKGVHILIHGTWEHFTLHGKKHFTTVLKLETLRWRNYTALCRSVQHNHWLLKTRRAFLTELTERFNRAGFDDGGRRLLAKECEQPTEGEGHEIDLTEPSERDSALLTHDFST